jgi:hypothetical protein
MKAYWESWGIVPHILDLGTRWRLVVSFTPRPLYPQGKIIKIIFKWQAAGTGEVCHLSRKCTDISHVRPIPTICYDIPLKCKPHSDETTSTTTRRLYTRAYPKVSGLSHNEIYVYRWCYSLRSNTKGYGGKAHWTDSQNSDITTLSGRELYHLQFSLQAASPETFGYTLVSSLNQQSLRVTQLLRFLYRSEHAYIYTTWLESHKKGDSVININQVVYKHKRHHSTTQYEMQEHVNVPLTKVMQCN